MTKIEWTSEMIFELQRLQALEENLTFNTIAKLMSEKFGVAFTRNSMVGKAYRLGLPPRPLREPVAKPCAITPRSSLPPIIRKRKMYRTRLIELLEGQCKWPAGEGPYFFCGKPSTGDGSPYCAFHASLAYDQKRRNVQK